MSDNQKDKKAFDPSEEAYLMIRAADFIRHTGDSEYLFNGGDAFILEGEALAEDIRVFVENAGAGHPSAESMKAFRQATLQTVDFVRKILSRNTRAAN